MSADRNTSGALFGTPKQIMCHNSKNAQPISTQFQGLLNLYERHAVDTFNGLAAEVFHPPRMSLTSSLAHSYGPEATNCVLI